MNLQELKKQTPAELITQAEKLGIENPSTLRKQEILFSILKKLAEKNEQITGGGVLEVLQDGFGFLRAIESNYLPGPDDIYVSPSQIRRFGLRTGDSVEGEIRAPKDAERYFALLKVNQINFENPEKGRNKIAFDNLTPLYPNSQLKMEIEKNTQVSVVMGSQSDYKIMKLTAKTLKKIGIKFETKIISAHRTPKRMYEFASSAVKNNIGVIIAGAGGSAHLPGMISSLTSIPVIGVPIETKKLKGLDSLLSIVQMPKGCPTATMAINGAFNAGLHAASIIGIFDLKIRSKLEKWKRLQTKSVKKKPK